MISLLQNAKNWKTNMMMSLGFVKKCTIEMFLFGSLANDEFSRLCDFDLPYSMILHPHLKLLLTLWACPILVIMILMSMCLKILILATSLYLNPSLQLSSTDFSILHTNIRSLSLHHDELVSLSVHTNLNPAVIGVSEILIQLTIPCHQMLISLAIPFFKTQSQEGVWPSG